MRRLLVGIILGALISSLLWAGSVSGTHNNGNWATSAPTRFTCPEGESGADHVWNAFVVLDCSRTFDLQLISDRTQGLWIVFGDQDYPASGAIGYLNHCDCWTFAAGGREWFEIRDNKMRFYDNAYTEPKGLLLPGDIGSPDEPIGALYTSKLNTPNGDVDARLAALEKAIAALEGR